MKCRVCSEQRADWLPLYTPCGRPVVFVFLQSRRDSLYLVDLCERKVLCCGNDLLVLISFMSVHSRTAMVAGCV